MARTPSTGAGAGGYCVCVGCGQREAHRPGVPCRQMRCPRCGKVMLREGPPHHQEALALRMYALVNQQHCEWVDGGRLRFVMDRCRVQETRRRKGLPDFPCRPVGEVEFSTFARTVDPRIRTTCLSCPPDAPAGGACVWEFSLAEITPSGVERREGDHGQDRDPVL